MFTRAAQVLYCNVHCVTSRFTWTLLSIAGYIQRGPISAVYAGGGWGGGLSTLLMHPLKAMSLMRATEMIKALFITTLLDKDNRCTVYVSVFLHSLIKTL